MAPYKQAVADQPKRAVIYFNVLTTISALAT
jgi:hypothetical protein